jgi:hypothetical protein
VEVGVSETALRLKAALDSLVEISEQQSRDLDSARTRTLALEAELMRRLEARANGDWSPFGPFDFDPGPAQTLDEIQTAIQHRIGLLDLAASLARELESAGEVSGAASEIVSCLAEIRAIDREAPDDGGTLP